MRLFNLAGCLAAVAVFLSGCGGGSGSAPSASTATSNGSPAVSTSSSGGSTSGSTSGSGTGSATISWTAPTANTDGSALTDLAGYHIHYGSSSGSMTQDVDVVSAGAQTYTISGLAAGTWYFAVSAYTSAGTESALSTVGSKTIT